MSLPSKEAAAAAVASVIAAGIKPQVGLVLGSGLGDFADAIESARVTPYSRISGMPQSRVAGHDGRLHLGTIDGVGVACLQGRVHAYEGHSVESVCFGVSLLAALGCRVVLLTNAAGGLSPSLEPGSLMLIRDHLNLTGLNPLLGPVGERVERFVDLSDAYDGELRRLAHEVASAESTELHEGVYAAMLGPSYETPAEVRMLSTLGASAVGMSTALEAIALVALGVRVGAISCITNLAAGLGSGPITHEEVQVTAERVKLRFERLLRAWIRSIGAQH